MRDDHRVDIFTVILALAMVAQAFSGAFRAGDDGPNWDLRWRGLDPVGRARVEAAVRSNAKVIDPEEVELAAGLRRHERRRRAYLELTFVPLILVAAALALFGTLPTGTFPLVISMVFFVTEFIAPRVSKRRGGIRRAATPPHGSA